MISSAIGQNVPCARAFLDRARKSKTNVRALRLYIQATPSSFKFQRSKRSSELEKKKNNGSENYLPDQAILFYLLSLSLSLPFYIYIYFFFFFS
jgi:hypothetical protein